MTAPQEITPPRVHPPVLVLGSHRSGASAIMGLLATAGGLEIGDVMPALPTNPETASFESVAVVKAHNDILATLDRDWTCPPPTFDPGSVPLAGIRAETVRLASSGRPWGVKDPLLVYMLPAWADCVPDVILVGVVRDHEDVVRSLQARHRLHAGVADTIARAYVRRLRQLRDRFEFPVINTSDPASVLRQTASVARALGLAWNDEQAGRLFEQTLLKRRSTGTLTSDDVDSLRGWSEQPPTRGCISTASLRLALADLGGEPDEFDRYSGPRTNVRRAACWRRVPASAMTTAVELTRNLRVASSLGPEHRGGLALQCGDLETLQIRLRGLATSPDVLLLPDVTSWLGRDHLATALSLVHDHLALDGVVVVGLSRADADVQRSHGIDPITPDEVRAAALGSGFVALPATGDDRMAVLSFAALASTTTLIRAVLDRVEDRSTPDDSSVGAAQPDWRALYERLRGRRSVRLALAGSASLRPLFRMVRRVRKRLRRDA